MATNLKRRSASTPSTPINSQASTTTKTQSKWTQVVGWSDEVMGRVACRWKYGVGYYTRLKLIKLMAPARTVRIS